MGKKNHEMGNGTVRNYKDTVFRMLFNDKTELLALYGQSQHAPTAFTVRGKAV